MGISSDSNALGKLYTKYPTVDVVIPTYNSETIISRCLEGIKNQQYPGIVNIIIIDGGSTDRTVEIAKTFHCEIYILPGIYSNGLTGARNIALKYCHGDLYWAIDTDNVLIGKDVLYKIVRPFMDIADIHITLPMTAWERSQHGMDKWLAVNEQINVGSMAETCEKKENWLVIRDMSFGLTNASLVRTTSIKEVGGYDSDVRVLRRMRSKGLSRGVVVLDAFFYHYQAESYIKWLKKLNRRIKMFSSFDYEYLNKYFEPTSHDHKYQREHLASLVRSMKNSAIMLKKKRIFFIWGFFFNLGPLLIFMLHPLKFARTFRRFL